MVFYKKIILEGFSDLFFWKMFLENVFESLEGFLLIRLIEYYMMYWFSILVFDIGFRYWFSILRFFILFRLLPRNIFFASNHISLFLLPPPQALYMTIAPFHLTLSLSLFHATHYYTSHLIMDTLLFYTFSSLLLLCNNLLPTLFLQYNPVLYIHSKP